MVRALGKKTLEPAYMSPKRPMFNLDKRKYFIPKRNGSTGREVPFKEDIDKGKPR